MLGGNVSLRDKVRRVDCTEIVVLGGRRELESELASGTGGT